MCSHARTHVHTHRGTQTQTRTQTWRGPNKRPGNSANKPSSRANARMRCYANILPASMCVGGVAMASPTPCRAPRPARSSAKFVPRHAYTLARTQTTYGAVRPAPPRKCRHSRTVSARDQLLLQFSFQCCSPGRPGPTLSLPRNHKLCRVLINTRDIRAICQPLRNR